MNDLELEAEYVGTKEDCALFRLPDGTTLQLPASVLSIAGPHRDLVLKQPKQPAPQPDVMIEKLNTLIHGSAAIIP